MMKWREQKKDPLETHCFFQHLKNYIKVNCCSVKFFFIVCHNMWVYVLRQVFDKEILQCEQTTLVKSVCWKGKTGIYMTINVFSRCFGRIFIWEWETSHEHWLDRKSSTQLWCCHWPSVLMGRWWKPLLFCSVPCLFFFHSFLVGEGGCSR